MSRPLLDAGPGRPPRGFPGPVLNFAEVAMDEHELAACAHHEAGHAVVARALGLRVRSMSMQCAGPGDAGHAGQVEIRYPCSSDGRQRFAIACFGGPLSEACYRGGTVDDLASRWSTSWSGDLHDLLRDRDIGMLAPLRQRAEALVVELWPVIERVAEALLQYGELSGDQINALL